MADVSLTLQDVYNSRISYKNAGSSYISEDYAIFLAMGQNSDTSTRVTFRVAHEDTILPQPSEFASFAITVEEGGTSALAREPFVIVTKRALCL